MNDNEIDSAKAADQVEQFFQQGGANAGANHNEQLEVIEGAIRQAFNDEYIESKTHLNDRQILACSVALSYADQFDVDMLRNLTLHLMRLRKSRNGISLSILTDMLKALTYRTDEYRDANSEGIMRKLFGRFGSQ